MLNQFFAIDGISSSAIGIELQDYIKFTAPTAKVERYSVPGRNGDIQIFDGSYNNVEGTAKCFVLTTARAEDVISYINRWALTGAAHRLEVSTEPDIYRVAWISSGAEYDIRENILAPFVLKFDCLPQRFLKSGEIPKRLTKSGAILFNPTGQPARPLITVHGSGAGVLTVGGATLSLADCNEVVLDYDSENAYRGSENMNGGISGSYTALGEGQTAISWTGGITGIDIKPRWWSL